MAETLSSSHTSAIFWNLTWSSPISTIMSRHGPNLLTLPNEILQRILEDVHPDDVENVCLASKLLRVLGASRLREHEGLKSQYTELHISYEPQIPPFGGGDEGPEMRTAFQILYDISENPRIAYYPKYAELYSCDLVWDDRYIGDPATTENDQNIAKREVGFLSLAQGKWLASIHHCILFCLINRHWSQEKD